MPHYFYNETYLDRAFMTKFGLSVKDEGAIGQFGTGIKYAIATVLRGGGTVHIRTGHDEYAFSTRIEHVRGHRYEIIVGTLNDDEEFDLPFTLKLGKNWKPWMAYREFLCNAWDEGGDVSLVPTRAETVITVSWNAFDELNLDEYFVRDTAIGEEFMSFPKHGVTIMVPANAKHRGRVYFDGVLVLQSGKSPFTYLLEGEDWKHELTEDRTIVNEYILWSKVCAFVNDNADIDQLVFFWQQVITSGGPERAWLREPRVGLQDQFIEAVHRGKIPSDTAREYAAKLEVRKPTEARQMNEREAAAVKECVEILHAVGIPFNYSILVKDTKSTSILGGASDDTVYLYSAVFHTGRRVLLQTLLEEYVHLHHGVPDCSRAMQNTLQEYWARAVAQATGINL